VDGVRAFERWVRRHERQYLTAFFTVFLTLAALFAFEGYRDGDETQRAAIVVATALGLAGTLIHQLVLWRRGRLILRDPEERRLNRKRIDRGPTRLGSVLATAALLTAGYFGGRGGVFALLGSVLLGYTPVMLWIAWVVRPDRTPPGERLEAG
jgi:hypothetical protein